MRAYHSSMPESEHGLMHYLAWLLVVATFLVAGEITGVGHDPSWLTINLFFLVSGIFAFFVLLGLNRGKNVKQLVGIGIFLAFLPTFVFLFLVAGVLGIILLVLAIISLIAMIILRIVLGLDLSSKVLGAILGPIAGFILWILGRKKNRGDALPLEDDSLPE